MAKHHKVRFALYHQKDTMHTYAQNYLAQLRSYQHELLQRLELLVNIDSGTGQREGIDQVISHVQQWLSDIGFSITLHDAEPYGHNLLARRSGKGQARLLLVGHVATVYSQGTAPTPSFHIRDDIAYVTDGIYMKSGVS